MRKILVVFLAVMFIPLTCASGFADLNVGEYELGGYLEVGGGFLANYPNARNRGYLEEYLPFPVGPLANTDLSLKSKDGLEYYNFRMSHPGLRDQDYLLQIGKLGVYHAEIEYDQLQHLYATVNPYNDDMAILLQRLRFNADYTPTPELDLFVEDIFLRRTGQQPSTLAATPTGATGGPYAFTTYTRPISYSQNDLRVGAEYDKPMYQFRLGYHFATFDDGLQNENFYRVVSTTTNPFVSLPPSNMANYVTAEGGLNLLAYKTRITGSFSYGWLTENDTVFDEKGISYGAAGLSATTVNGDISGVTRPIEGLSLRYSYKAYDFENNHLNNNLLLFAFSGTSRSLLYQEQYSYLRQTVTAGADYKVNSMLALDAGYAFSSVDRTENQGNTSSNSPQFGIRLFPTSWLNLIANYAYSQRLGSDFLSLSPGNLLTYKFYSGDDRRNTANFIAEAFPVNNVTFSANFSFYKDTFNNSNGYGLNNDQGWSAGADVSWTPIDRVALSLGYDHQEAITKERTAQLGLVPGSPPPAAGLGFVVTGDWGPLLSTLDSYDTVTARADFKLIPNKLKLTTSASYSFSSSHFDNPVMPDLNEAFADINTSLSYKFNEHWGARVGYQFEIFNMTKSYQDLYLAGLTSGGTKPNQSLNTLDGFYRNATAHVVELFLQYNF